MWTYNYYRIMLSYLKYRPPPCLRYFVELPRYFVILPRFLHKIPKIPQIPYFSLCSHTVFL